MAEAANPEEAPQWMTRLGISEKGGRGREPFVEGKIPARDVTNGPLERMDLYCRFKRVHRIRKAGHFRFYLARISS